MTLKELEEINKLSAMINKYQKIMKDIGISDNCILIGSKRNDSWKRKPFLTTDQTKMIVTLTLSLFKENLEDLEERFKDC